jgi:hypothetical protein
MYKNIKGGEWMQSIIWAFGSMLVLLLIISVLPLGFTVKGKLSIVVVSFVLALGGLAAVLAVPLWQTALMLAALTFFTAYFMDKRMGALLFIEIPSFVEEVNDEYEIPAPVSKIDKENNNNSLELQELGIIDPLISMTGDSRIFMQPSKEQATDNEMNLQDEDISFLLERDSENDVEQKEELVPENNFLSEIESLLAAEIDDEENSDDHNDTNKFLPLDDSSIDFLDESIKVAIGQDDGLEEEKKK